MRRILILFCLMFFLFGRTVQAEEDSYEGSTEVTASVVMPEETADENTEEQYYHVQTGDENVIFVPLILFLLSGIVAAAEGVKRK